MELQRPLATVTPTLDGDVLAVLAVHSAAFTTGQLHRMLPAFSEEGIRKVLARLTRQGVVQSSRVGNAYSYQLNPEHLAAAAIIALANLRSTLLGRLEERLKTWDPSPLYAAVFGSAARGSMKPESDIDLVLVRADDTEQDAWDRQVAALVDDVTRWTGNDTRPLEYTESELAGVRDERVIQDILVEGLTVAGTHAWLHRTLRFHPVG